MLNRGPDSLWSLKIPGCPSIKSRVLPRHPGQTSPLASDHHGLLIIPIHWLASSLCLLSTSKLVCGGRSGALWLPSHHPGGCCTLVVDEEIAPLLCKALWVSRKALYKCNKLLLLLYSLFPKFFLVGFSHVFTAALSRTGLLCGEWCGPKSQAGGEESSWIGKDSERRQASNLF